MGGARFRYALEPIALQRQWALDALLRELSDCNAELGQRLEARAAEQERIDQAGREWKQLGRDGQGVQVERYALLSRYLADRRGVAAQLQQALQAVQRRRDELIASVAEAQRALEAVDEHREDMRKLFVRTRVSGEFKDADDQWNVLQTVRAADGN